MISKVGNKVYLSKEFEDEDVKQFLIDNYLKMTTAELAKKLNSTMPKVNGALMYFGLSKGIKGTPLCVCQLLAAGYSMMRIVREYPMYTYSWIRDIYRGNLGWAMPIIEQYGVKRK